MVDAWRIGDDRFRVRLERPSARRRDEFLAAVRRSAALHRPWVAAPASPGAFDEALRRIHSGRTIGAWVVERDADALAGVVNANEIVRGAFHSAYLGFYGFTPWAGSGRMREGVALAIDRLFRRERLHRLEANVVPQNRRSLALVRALGFRREGRSPRYLRVGGRWRDHERWALLREEWRGPTAVVGAAPEAPR